MKKLSTCTKIEKMGATWKNITTCLAQLQEWATRTDTNARKGAANWHAMFMFMAEQCKRPDERERERTSIINRNVEEICSHPTAIQILREVLLSLTLTESSRRIWSAKTIVHQQDVGDERKRVLPQQYEYVIAQSDDERRQVLLALLKCLFCMSNINTARKEFFQNGFLVPLYSIALSPLCMCFAQNVNQFSRNVKHLSSCQKNCAETLNYIAHDDAGDIRFHSTNILCNMCFCDPLKELIGGISGAGRVRALIAIAEYTTLQKQYRIVAAALAALRNLTSQRINTRILGALQMYGRLIQLLQSVLSASEKWPDNVDIAMCMEHLFVVFLNASKSVRAVECMSLQTSNMFRTLGDVCAKLKNGNNLYVQFDHNCDLASVKREQNEFDSSDEGSLEADDLIQNFDLSDADNRSAADATDTSGYETTRRKQASKQQKTTAKNPQQLQQKPLPARQLLAEDERLLESAQVFVNEQKIDTTGTQRVSGAHLRIDSTVPHFDFSMIKLGETIGKGTYSIVHCAQYCGFRMAAKILNTPLPETAVAREKVLLEFRLMALLRHPNIVQLMGFSCSPSTNQLVVCTEFCARGSLKDNLDTINDIGIRIRFAKHVIAGLYWLHSNNIIHRDLKPANLLVREDYSVVVADFGLSLYIGASKEDRPLSRHFKGNVKYSAPEILQLRSVKNGQRGRQYYRYSFASDVYSFALILWEIFSPELKLFNHVKRGRTGITEFVVSGGRPKFGAGWPASLTTLLGRCWHADPDRRLTFDRIQQQFDSIVVDFMCPDFLGRAVAKSLWQKNDGRPVRFADFEHEFEAATGLNLQQIPKGNDYRHCLQFMLCDKFGQRPNVTFERFCDMLQYIGSMSPIEQFLENLLQLFKQPWFFGFIRKDEAATLLAHALHEDRTVQGYYLLRFSCTHKGSYVLHMITKAGRLLQRSIAHQYGSNYTATLDDIHTSEFPSLFNLLKDCNQCDTCLKGMIPITSSPFVKYFKTYQIETVPSHRSSDSSDIALPLQRAPPPIKSPAVPKQQQQPKTAAKIAQPPRPVVLAQPPAARPDMMQVQPPHNPVQTAPIQRHLAGKTISLVSAAKTASSVASGSRWRSSMSSSATKKASSKTKNNDLLKYL